MKIKNIYREGISVEIFEQAQVASNWGILEVLAEDDVQAKNGGIILSSGAVESKTGILLYRLVNAGDNFAFRWSAEPGDLFLISHLAGDRVGKYVFVEEQDVLMKYGKNIFKES
jgi:hypothetical protein